jgi:hypothetical protein
MGLTPPLWRTLGWCRRSPGTPYDLGTGDAAVERREERDVNLEETLDKLVEMAREELHIVRKRSEEKTPARDHGNDYHEAQAAADRLDHYAHQLHRLHDAAYGDGWRHHSATDRD